MIYLRRKHFYQPKVYQLQQVILVYEKDKIENMYSNLRSKRLTYFELVVQIELSFPPDSR